MPKSDFRFFHPLRVRWAECDAQAIAYNAVYLTWAEVAQAEYCRHLGFAMYRLAELNLFDTVTARAAIDFKAPARIDDLLEVYVRVADIGNTSLAFVFEIYRKGQEQLLSRIETVYVSYDNKAQRPRRVPREIREVFSRFEATGERPALAGVAFFKDALV